MNVADLARRDRIRAFRDRLRRLPPVLDATRFGDSTTRVVVSLEVLEQIVEGRRSATS